MGREYTRLLCVDFLDLEVLLKLFTCCASSCTALGTEWTGALRDRHTDAEKLGSGGPGPHMEMPRHCESLGYLLCRREQGGKMVAQIQLNRE